MMAGRRSFAEVVLSSNVDPEIEYSTLWRLFNQDPTDPHGLNAKCPRGPDYLMYVPHLESFCRALDRVFLSFPIVIRKTYRSLNVFNRANGFNFDDREMNVDLDKLLTYVEYTLSLITVAKRAELLGEDYDHAIALFNDHCQLLADRLGHQIVHKDDLVYLVPKSMPVFEVARLMPEDLSYKTLMYNHRSTTGDLEKKREILYALYHQFEPRRKGISNELDGVISGLVNNFNVRHNNCDPADVKKFNPKVANLSKEDREKIYDDIYELLLLAFMELDAKSVILSCKDLFEDIRRPSADRSDGSK